MVLMDKLRDRTVWHIKTFYNTVQDTELADMPTQAE